MRVGVSIHPARLDIAVLQNSKEWLEWRRQGLGASDAVIVMGISPYKTRRQLWENKLGLRPDDPESFITELGHKFEPMARAQFSLETDIDLESDICLVHPEFKFLRASLDGHNFTQRTFAEIKMVGAKKMAEIKELKAPIAEHVPQIQQQFLVSGYERGFYIAYSLTEDKSAIKDFCHVPVVPDRPYMDRLFTELKSFWDLVLTQEPPELEERDVYEFKDRNVSNLAKQYKMLKAEIDELTEKFDKVESEIKSISSAHAKVKIGDLSINRVIRQGNVQYKNIPELASVDLDKYRGKASIYQTIKVAK